MIVGKGFQVLKYEKLGFKSQLMGAGLVFPYITVRAMLNDQHRMRVFTTEILSRAIVGTDLSRVSMAAGSEIPNQDVRDILSV